MKLRLLNDTDTLKSTDNATKLKFAITDNQDTILSLEQYTAITVAIGQNGARYSSEAVEIVDDKQAFEFSLTNSLPASIYNIEVTLTTAEGTNHIAPSEGIFKLTIEKSLNEVGDAVTILSVQQLIDDMASTLRVAEEANEKSNDAVAKAESAIATASTAKTTADNAKTTADGLASSISTANTNASDAKIIAQQVRSDFDDLTSNNTDAELINSRTDETGVVHSDLKTRIDSESAKRLDGDASTLQSAKDYTDSKVGYTKEEKEKLESVETGANKYVAPIATTTGFGDVKVGMNITAVNGIISVVNGTVSTKGVVQLTDSVTSTSTTTAATANAVKMANDAIKNASADTSSLQANFIDLAIEVETSKNAELTGVNANIAIETFLNLDDVTLERGAYDATNKWIEV